MKFSDIKIIKWLIGLPMKTKIISAVVAGTIAVGSGVGIGIAVNNSNEPEHTHSYTQQTTTEATCTTKGVITYTCSCNDTYTEEIPATGVHTWDNGKITTEPTCTGTGVKTFTCTVCETATYTEDVAELNHDKVQHNAQAATCTAIGWNAYETCTRCDYTTYVELPALTHDKVQHNAQAATCTEIGWNAYETCTRCDYTTYVELPALNHDKVQHNAQAATCTEKGWNAYETCTRCSYTTYVEIPALNHDKVQHNAQSATCTEKGWNAYETCTRCDYTTYVELPALNHDKVQHNAQAATCTEIGWNAYETCTRCSYTTYKEISALNHDKVQHNAQAATCTEIGWNVYETCTRCDYTTYVEIPALMHDKVHHNAQSATCTEKGWNAYETCTRCDYTTYVEIPALTHDKVQHNAQAATCTEIGWEAYETCSRCDYTTYIEIPALNHDKVQHNAQAATCTEIGWNAYETCSRCDYTTYVEIPALNHDKVQHNAQAATCTEIGWNAYETCTRCDYTTYVELSATGVHIWDSGKNTTEPTCTEKGIKTFTCTTCTTANYTEDVPAMGHSEVEHPEEPATCQKSGFTAYVTCSNCSYATERTVIPIQSHSFKYYISDGNATCVKSGTKTALCEYGCGEKDVAEESAGTHYPVFDEDIVKPTSTSVGYYEYWVFCYYCEMYLAHDIITLSGSGSSSGASDSDRWRSNPLLANVPYPTGATVQTLELDNMNTQLGDYYGWAGGYFTASKSVIDNYLSQVSASAYTYNVQKTYGSYVGYNASKTRMLSVGFVGNKLTILLYKVKNESTNVGTNDHICKFSVAVYESPTCTQQGYEVFYCVYGCGKSYLERSLPWGHLLLETVEGYEPTCTNTGLTDGVFCWECETTVVKQTEIPALGHNDVDGLCSRCEIPIEYKIDFIVDGEIYTTLPFNVNTMNSLIIPVVPDKKGHTGVWADFEMKKESFSVEAIYTPITYTISYELNGGTNHASNPTEYVFGTSHTLYTPTIDEELVIFGGWFTDNTFTAASAVSQISSDMAGNITLYAQWLRYRVEEAEGFNINYYGAMPELSTKVSNAMERFDFKGKITVSEGCTWKVYGDEYSSISYDLKVVPLNTGNNTYYIVVFHPDGEYYTQYVVKIYRRKMYTVSFDTKGGTEVEDQIVEEDSFATIPETTRLGYTFDSWDYDFITPIIWDTEITANWKANDNTKYTVEYYLQNLENDKYTLYESIECIGTTDTLAIAEIKEYKHFTYNEQASLATITGNINPDGSCVLSVYYMRNSYSIVVENYVDSDCISDGSYDSVIYCDVCQDELLRETVVIPAKGHDYVFHESKMSTCLEIGWNEYNTCSRCYYTDYVENPALGHDYIVHEAQTVTCFEIGWNEYNTCSRCDYSTYEEIKPTDIHNVENGCCIYCNRKESTQGLAYSQNPDGTYTVTSIGDCTATEIVIDIYNNRSVTAIKSSAFKNCSSLKSVVIGDSVTSIGSSAFYGCSSLTEITIPFVGAEAGKTASDTYQYPFGYIFGTSSYTGGTAITQYYYGSSTSTTASTKYYIPSSLKSVTITGGNILYGAFRGCSSLTSVTIPDSVTSIGSYAFYNCSSLTSVIIGDSVTSIGEYAFRGCSSLTSVTIPDSVTSIGDYAFYYCTNLTSVEIGDSVTSIGERAFRGCSSLTSVTIPDSVTSIGSSAFFGCSSLTEITLPFVGATKGGTEYTHFGYIFGSSYHNDSCVPTSLKSVTITGGSIRDCAFEDCGRLTSVIIGDSVTSIGNEAFYNCDGLTSITIPNSVTSIGSYAFRYCDNLKSITLEDTSTWYRTTSRFGWYDKEGGMRTSVTDSSTNAYYFKSTYVDYYWYKL